MADKKTKVLLDIEVDGGKAVDALAKYQKEIDELKKSQKELKEELKKGNITQDEYYKKATKTTLKLEDVKRKTRAVKKEMQDQEKALKTNAGSLVDMRNKLRKMTSAYDNLSESERKNADIGVKQQQNIANLTNQLKDEEAATERYQRNVGNYTNSMREALKGMETELAKQAAAYEKLSTAEKKNEKVGGAQVVQMKQLKSKIKDTKREIVLSGEASEDYEKKMAKMTAQTNGLIGSNLPAVKSIQSMTTAVKSAGGVMPLLKGGLMAVKTGVIQLGRALLSLLANPVVLILAAIAAAIYVVVKATQQLNKIISESEDLSAKNNETMARSAVWHDKVRRMEERQAKALIETRRQREKAIKVWNGAIIAMGDWIAKASKWAAANEYIKNGVPFVSKLLDLQGKAWAALTGEMKEHERQVKEYQDLVRDNAKLVKDQRTLNEETAKRETEIARLRADASDKENVSAEDRLAMLTKARDLAVKNASEQRAIAAERLRLLEIEGRHTENNAEFNNKLSQAKIAVTNADKNLYSIEKSLNRELTTTTREIKAQEAATKAAEAAKKKAAQEAYVARVEEAKGAKDEEAKIAQATQDFALSLMKEGIDKQIALAKNNSAKQISEIQKRLDEDTTLTTEARAQLNEQIELQRAQLNQTLQELNHQEMLDAIATEEAKLDAKLKFVKEGTDEELATQKQKLIMERDSAMRNAEAIGMDTANINSYYEEQEQALIDINNEKRLAKQQELLTAEFEQRLLQAELDGETDAELKETKHQLELERKQRELDELHQLEGESDEDFKARRLDAQVGLSRASLRIQADQVAKEKALQQSKLKAFSAVTGAIDSLITASGNKSKAMLVFSKTIALANVYLSQGMAIANAIRTATQSSATVFDLVANVATSVATVVTSTVSAFSAINKADSATAAAPKFAVGGYVSGPGTSTSDSISASLSNGESVINAESTSMFGSLLSSINQAGGGVPIEVEGTSDQAAGVDVLAAAVAKGMQSAPQPIVSVEDINAGYERVGVIESVSELS